MNNDRCDERIKRVQINQIEFDGLTLSQVWPVRSHRIQTTGDTLETLSQL
jgi:hypothetical protein